MTEQQRSNGEALYVSSSDKLAFIYLDKTDSDKLQKDIESQKLISLVNQEHLDRILRKAGVNINKDSEKKRFLNSYNRMTDFANYTNDLTVGFIREKEDVTYLQANSYFIALVGGMHIVDQSVNELAGMSIKYDFAEVQDDLQVFQNTRACCLYFNFGELCLKDLLTDKKNHSLPECYEFLALANSFARRPDFPKFFNDNKDSVWSKFPMHAMTEASYSAATIMALTQASGEGIKEFALSVGNRIEEKNKESLLSAVKIIKRIEEIKKETYSILVNPESPQFSELGLKLLSFFEESRGTQVLALAAAGLDQGNNFINLYRFSREALRKGVEVGFYQELNRVLSEIIEETEPFYPGFSIEDLPSILFLEKEEGTAPVPEISSFKRTVTEIFSKSSQLTYQLKREDVDWGRMVPAEKVDITFNANQPLKFEVSLGYFDDSGQTINLNVDIDLKTNNMDWSIRESPSDPDLEVLRKEVMRFTYSALNRILIQIEQKKKQIAEEKNRLNVSLPGPKQEKIRPPKEPKIEKETKKRPLSFLDKALATIEEQSEQPNLRTEILLPEGLELDYLFRDLTPEDTGRVLKKIREHNFSGAGLIIPLEDEINGETLYKFRVGNKRVVLIEDGCTDEIKRFIPIRVANRKIIYKKLGI